MAPLARLPPGRYEGAVPARRTRKPDQRRRALELRASCDGQGCAEGLMLAHGFSIGLMVELVRAGLATATAQRVVAGQERYEIAMLRITDAGRRAL